MNEIKLQCNEMFSVAIAILCFSSFIAVKTYVNLCEPMCYYDCKNTSSCPPNFLLMKERSPSDKPSML